MSAASLSRFPTEAFALTAAMCAAAAAYAAACAADAAELAANDAADAADDAADAHQGTAHRPTLLYLCSYLDESDQFEEYCARVGCTILAVDMFLESYLVVADGEAAKGDVEGEADGEAARHVAALMRFVTAIQADTSRSVNLDMAEALIGLIEALA